ncbi:multicopper oxidase domain-containing protein [Candidatus Nitrososphaera sp. FF02]|uniref:multicopper oxidase domain-containing protein n=1 Tax=Candidatus Nitrososphaera sp. FF02 TaxID=3398226 RepID=UPI0039EB1DD5
MNKAIIAGVAAGVLVVGLIFSPIFNVFPLSSAQADHTGVTRHVTLIADETVVQVAPDNALHPGGLMYNAMTFNGTIPGPVVAVNQGDVLEITLTNEGDVIHSIDFHAGIGPSQVLSGNVGPGESKTWTLHAETAGAFFYHCGADGLNGVWEHIANGMYGGIIVHAQKEKPAKEFYVVFGEIYNSEDRGLFQGDETPDTAGSFDVGKFAYNTADLVLTNGMAHKYVPAVGTQSQLPLNPELLAEMEDGNLENFFLVKPGELTRWYIAGAGPNDGVAFHFISGMIDVRDGSVRGWNGKSVTQDETWYIPVGSMSVIEAVFPEEGIYVGVDHNMADVVKGGAFAVVATESAEEGDNPPGTWVPSKAWLDENTSSAAMGSMTDSGEEPEEGSETQGNSTTTEG